MWLARSGHVFFKSLFRPKLAYDFLRVFDSFLRLIYCCAYDSATRLTWITIWRRMIWRGDWERSSRSSPRKTVGKSVCTNVSALWPSPSRYTRDTLLNEETIYWLEQLVDQTACFPVQKDDSKQQTKQVVKREAASTKTEQYQLTKKL